MKPAHRAAAGAAALLATGLVGVGTANTASATACTARITSVQQLKANIAQAVVVEKQSSGSALSVLPQGGWPPRPIIPPDHAG